MFHPTPAIRTPRDWPQAAFVCSDDSQLQFSRERPSRPLAGYGRPCLARTAKIRREMAEKSSKSNATSRALSLRAFRQSDVQRRSVSDADIRAQFRHTSRTCDESVSVTRSGTSESVARKASTRG